MSDEMEPKSISEAIGTLIAKVCYKAADELGEGFAEKTSRWRQQNALRILENTEKKIPSYF